MAMDEDVRAFSSKVVDLRSIPKESAGRIASLLQARRARVISETAAAVSQEQVITSMGLDEMEAEERAGRDGILKQEQKGYDWSRRQLQDALLGSEASFNEYQKVTKWETARNKKVRDLEQQILRESFWNFQRRAGVADHNTTKTQRERSGAPVATIDDATVVLGSMFENSMVPFATDVEECWRRGITQHPSQQTTATVGSPDRRRTTTIQPYYEFAEQLRNEYRSKPQDEWWRSPRPASQHPTSTQYRSTPMATFAHNYPYHVPPQ
ncbi:Hypothetical protein, putative [Bodo saltans]|uniref:Uncharacterized protein n=1 Tax=Bodo saltans TaxID=75058 RepID=A0A0S4KLT7_BODSA|nr:Hypothetical protein, putative [Bodo saltans]|eukprot:CUI15340.1 Hypothetical protein, putative [Bodo saltans]